MFVNEIKETGMGDFHRSLCSKNPESFIRFGNNRRNRDRDPMEYPKSIWVIKQVYSIEELNVNRLYCSASHALSACI